MQFLEEGASMDSDKVALLGKLGSELHTLHNHLDTNLLLVKKALASYPDSESILLVDDNDKAS